MASVLYLLHAVQLVRYLQVVLPGCYQQQEEQVLHLVLLRLKELLPKPVLSIKLRIARQQQPQLKLQTS